MKSDIELVEAVKNGETKEFAELVKRHQNGLFRLCLRFVRDVETAEDVVQESLVKAFRKINTFEGRASFKSWVYQIAVNTAKNKLRARKRQSVDLENVDLSVAPQAESDLQSLDVKSVIKNEIDKLPERQKTALILRIYEDLSFREIAKMMSCPYDTAKANYRHGFLKLKSALETNEELREWSSGSDSFVVELSQRMVEVE